MQISLISDYTFVLKIDQTFNDVNDAIILLVTDDTVSRHIIFNEQVYHVNRWLKDQSGLLLPLLPVVGLESVPFTQHGVDVHASIYWTEIH